MNFLEICQRVRQECGIAGEGPSSTIGMAGILKKVVDRTARAWVDIQVSKPYWKFLRNRLTDFPLIIGQREYTMLTAQPAGFGTQYIDKFDEANSYIYTTSTADESRLSWIPYREFRARYRTYPDGRPTRIYTGLNGTVGFDRTPDAAYVINLDYWETPELLVNPNEIPACPEQYHDMIIWKSVMTFAGAEMATDLFAFAATQYGPLYKQLVLDQCEVPAFTRNFPLAGKIGGGSRVTFQNPA